MRKTLLAIMMVGLLATQVHAAIDWEDGFEYASKAAQNAVWDSSCPTDLTNWFSSTERAHTGSRSFKMEVLGQAGVDPSPPYGSCFMSRDLSLSTSSTLYTRAYIYLTGPSGTGPFQGGIASSKIYATNTKNMVTSGAAYPNFWWLVSLFGGRNQAVTVEGVPDGSPPGTEGRNFAGLALPQNRWVCWETFAYVGTPGQANGMVQSWIDGQLSINRTNQAFLVTTDGQYSAPNSPNARFNSIRIYGQNGRGIIYIDDFAVSRDARIGCIGSNPDDTTPPSIPGSFTVQ